jgi:transposase
VGRVSTRPTGRKAELFKVPHPAYTAAFKEAAVQRVKDGQGVNAVAGELGMSTQTLRNWLKAFEPGKLNGPGRRSSRRKCVHGTRYRTHREAVGDWFEYIVVFDNRSRRHSSPGFMSPAQFMQDWLVARRTRDAAA